MGARSGEDTTGFTTPRPASSRASPWRKRRTPSN